MKTVAHILTVIGLALVVACQSAPTRAPTQIDGQPQVDVELSYGYARLHDLMGKLNDVDNSLFLFMKGPSDPVKQLLRNIADTADHAHERIETLVEDDPTIDLDVDLSAELEQETRSAIQSTTKSELMGAGGREFELRMLISQLESTRYGSHLAERIAEADPNEQRRDYLEQLAEQLEELRQRAFELLQ
jgi:hypothetical protein